MNLSVEIDGKHIPLADCDWVLWAPCGCPAGVTVAQSRGGHIVNATEDAAWREFWERKRDIDRRKRQGYRVELMTHERYSAEVYDLMRAHRCPHPAGGAA